MSESVEVIGIADRERWEAEHRQGGLPSQSWHYAWALSASGVEPKLAIVHCGAARMLFPFFERTFEGHVDIATILGLSGASTSLPAAALLAAWRNHAAAQGWVAGYLQLSPFQPIPELPVGDELATVNEVLLMDLRTTDLSRNFSEIRRKLRNARKSGVELVEDRGLLADALKRLYPATVERVGAAAHYRFSADSLERWATDESSVVLGARRGDRIEAVSLFSVAGPHAESHINASDDAGRDWTAWLIGQAIDELRRRGVTHLNLGGGVRPHDHLYRFKEKFVATALPLRAVRQIYDPARYRQLCERAGASGDASWFPAYRARRGNAA